MKNNEPASETNKPKSSKLIIIIGIAVLIILVAAGAVVMLGKSGKNKQTANTAVTNTASNNPNQNSNPVNSASNQNVNAATATNKVLGQSAGKLPYASIDEANIASAVIDSSGGVIKANLPKNVVVYFIVPEDEVIQGATISLVPYTAMPSGSSHGLLSDEYGYGVQVQVQSLQMGIRGYLVFDTTGGTATTEAQAKAPYFNRCDPNLKWFDPYLCAKKNKLPATTVVTKNATVITPIHLAKLNSVVFSQNTIPTGIDGLIALRVKGGDVFIPQKVDQELVNKITKDTLSEYSGNLQKLEAAGLALAWNVNNYSQTQMELISRLDHDEHYGETVKAMYVSQQFASLFKTSSLTITRGAFDDATNDELRADIEENLSDIAEAFLKDAQDVTETFGFDIDSIQAVAAINDAAQLGIAGASQALGTVQKNIASTGSSDSSSVARRSSALESSDYADPGSGEPPLTPEILQGIARDVVNHVWADPKATIEEILNAMYLARITGLENADEIIQQGLEKIIKILEQMLEDAKYRKDFLDIAEIACMLGLEDLCQEAVDKAKTAPPSPELCDLVKKNLSNYGINECSEE